jgi:RNA polymerase-binding transcription factor DksA
MISKTRLNAILYAAFCIKCKEETEKVSQGSQTDLG